ncbi:PepSY domain-containing protein [Rhizobium sp. ARZ01]|uniref:PepSY domain-containing protein n=1 Tax=Rhizobium sp. ARZ01 TaxID=2769313 RepID=UPI0017803C60|nr:PepSY domain-containing protein [Rhizobium sp. ARZ01]MBD9375589.1 PepSY domain-containing protein [Rhizobium sp. ARZ01]
MKSMFIGAFVLAATATAVGAQTSAPAAKPGDTPAIATPDQQNPAAPVAGENSFTEGQAKDRFAEAGYSDITDLKLDESGVWRAKAAKDGKAVGLSLDYQGNIVASAL